MTSTLVQKQMALQKMEGTPTFDHTVEWESHRKRVFHFGIARNNLVWDDFVSVDDEILSPFMMNLYWKTSQSARIHVEIDFLPRDWHSRVDSKEVSRVTIFEFISLRQLAEIIEEYYQDLAGVDFVHEPLGLMKEPEWIKQPSEK